MRKKARPVKIVGRVTEAQKVKLDEIVTRSDDNASYTGIMSAALEVYCWAADQYPIGIDLMPQIPQLVNDRRSSPKAPPRAKKRKS